ncbi:MAG: hypothetical protein IPH95_10270 [Candidatus Promineofilum sp.]|jgi:hypothetical protein|nr:hypothetical protein [Promineifilum sp.]
MRSQTKLAPFLIVCLLAVALLAVACGGAATTTTPTIAATEAAGGALATSELTATAPAAPVDGSYPAPVAESAGAYPAEGEAAVAEAYPPPAAEDTFLEPRFRIDQPVTVATTTLTGQAPPNLTLAVLDVTYNGAPLGMGQSDANGAFSIPVSGLVAGNRIGLAIGALPEGMDIAQTAEMYFPHRGEGFQNLPNVGVFYDSTLVQP